jgi:hypothetical protein
MVPGAWKKIKKIFYFPLTFPEYIVYWKSSRLSGQPKTNKEEEKKDD